MPSHTYRAVVTWTGNLGVGTRDYRAYSREHRIQTPGKPVILCSSNMGARADESRHNPDELLVAALSSCHMLWYLHLASASGVEVVSYDDEAEGTLEVDGSGAGRFVEVELRPTVGIASGSVERAQALHEDAHRKCFIANSVNFPVRCVPEVRRAARAVP